ncbi:hypothetical protein [Frigoriflavimonas asaccharolytica]|uniref:Uncharacterized protein n=1 Tax=Frigoriflavimonas asaccharolytica TaxID=2735899 RepID=A0A8J8G657_9FLAO|nr:hypothetical protein [Frigoriflavimonas asaccharolytica]NRS91731.1 hypothetical protein [Frigoriflavimonas asaccharolytica]
MILNKKNIKILENIGLEISAESSCIYIWQKELDKIDGNYEKNWMEYPRLDLKRDGENYLLKKWDFTPGPGPGDFNLTFKNEVEVVDFIKSYFLGSNPYREKLKMYIDSKRKSYSIDDLESVFKNVIDSAFKKFAEKEIPIFDRGTYNKIPIEKWSIVHQEPENPTISTNWGYLNYELSDLRMKINNYEEFNSEDLQKVASLIMDLSINLKN